MSSEYNNDSGRTPVCPNCDGAGFITNDTGDLLKCPTCQSITPKSSHVTPRCRSIAPELPTGQVRKVKVTWLGTRIDKTEEIPAS